MDNERALRTELRSALDDVLPPAPWLEAAVTEDLRKRLSRKRQGSDSRGSARARNAFPRWAIQLAAAVLIAAIGVAAVTTFIQLHHRAPQSIPASPLSIAAYQRLTVQDDTRLGNSANDACLTLESVCPAPGHPYLTALQQWLADLNHAVPPARFAVIDAQLRQHLAANISDIKVGFAAYQARDAEGLDRANFAGSHVGAWLDAVAAGIAASHEGTAAKYIASLGTANLNFEGCITCGELATVKADCTPEPSLACETDIASVMSTIGTVQTAVTEVTAPSSLAAPDAVLQRDLAQADTALIAMSSADLAGDQAAVQGGLQSLQQALQAVKADLAAILAS